MNKGLFVAAVAAAMILLSCQKEDVANMSEEPLVFTAVIADSPTKTAINTVDGKVSWEEGDEITISDGTHSAVYCIQAGTLASGDANPTATFTYKSGIKPSSSAASYTANYGEFEPYQHFSSTAGKLPMTGVSDSGNKTKLIFTVSCGLLKLNLTVASGDAYPMASGDATIKRIEIVTSSITPSEAVCYSLECSEAQDISSAKDFYIALPAGNYSYMRFINANGHACYRTATAPMTIEANAIQPVNLHTLYFCDILPGWFAVNAAGKKVRFSRGNLQATCTTAGTEEASVYSWGFAEHQFDFVGGAYQGWVDPTGNNTIGDQKVDSKVDLFGWVGESSTTLTGNFTKYGITVDNNAEHYGNASGDALKADWGTTIEKGVWRTLSKDEWDYLLNRSQTNKFAKARIGDKKGILIFPDNYCNSTVLAGIKGMSTVNAGNVAFPDDDNYFDWATWTAMEMAGVVFLPAAGYRDGSTVYHHKYYEDMNAGYYWSSSSQSDITAYCLTFGETSINIHNPGRLFGYSVRLVTTNPIDNFEDVAPVRMDWNNEEDNNNWQ